MKIGNLVGIVIIVVLMVVLLGMLFWYSNTVTGAAVSEMQTQQVQSLQTQLIQKDQRITSLQAENMNLRDNLAELKKEIEDAMANTAPAITSPPLAPAEPSTTEPLVSGSRGSDIDLTAAREDLTLRRQKEIYDNAIQVDRDDKARKLIAEKKKSILESNTLFQDRFRDNRITLVCDLGDTMLVTKGINQNWDDAFIWYYDSSGLGNIVSRSASLTESKDYSTTLICES